MGRGLHFEREQRPINRALVSLGAAQLNASKLGPDCDDAASDTQHIVFPLRTANTSGRGGTPVGAIGRAQAGEGDQIRSRPDGGGLALKQVCEQERLQGGRDARNDGLRRD